MCTKAAKKTVLVYLLTKNTPEFWEKIFKEKTKFESIFVFNISDEKIILEKELADIKIFNSTKGLLALNEYLYSHRLKFDFVLLLEQDEKVFLNSNFEQELMKLPKEASYNVFLTPEKNEVYDFDIEPFSRFETRLFYLKHKNIKAIFGKNDFSFNQDLTNLDTSFIKIQKETLDTISNLKLELITEPEKKKFFTAIANFYSNANESEQLFFELLKNDNYSTIAFEMILKLLYRRIDFDKIFELEKNYPDLVDKSTISKLYLAFSYYENKNYLQSIRYFNSFNKKKAELSFIYNYYDVNIKSYKVISEILYIENKLTCAEAFITKAKEMNTKHNSVELDFCLAKIKFKSGKYEESFEILKKLLELDFIPDYFAKKLKVTFLNLLAFIDFKEESLYLLKKEIFNKKEDLLRIADTFYLNEQYVEALRTYLLSVEKFGSDKNLLLKMGYICSKLKFLDQAIYYYESFLETDPEHQDALNNLAFVYMNNGQLDKAEKINQKILKINNFSFEANLYLALIYTSTNKKKKAEEYLDKAKMLNPISPEVIKLSQIIKAELF